MKAVLIYLLAASVIVFLLCLSTGALKGFTLTKTLQIMWDATVKADWPWHPWRQRTR